MKKYITPILGIYGIALIIYAFISAHGGNVNLLPIAGTLIAIFMYIRRYETEAIERAAVKIAYAAVALSTVVSLIFTFFHENIVSNILFNIVGGITMLGIILLCDKKLTFVKDCSQTVFWIAIAVSIFIVPSVLALFQGVLQLIVSVILIIAVAILLFSNLGDFLESCRSETKAVFWDKNGNAHSFEGDRNRANERIDSQKKD